MPSGTRQEGRVALVDFYRVPSRPQGWEDVLVYTVGLYDNDYKPLPEDASEAVKEARNFIFAGYDKKQYPHIISARCEPLLAILRSLAEARGMDEHDLSGQYIRQSKAKVSPDWSRAVLMSSKDRDIWPTLDPYDVNWDAMHYDERLLTIGDYRRITELDSLAFLKAIDALSQAPGYQKDRRVSDGTPPTFVPKRATDQALVPPFEPGAKIKVVSERVACCYRGARGRDLVKGEEFVVRSVYRETGGSWLCTVPLEELRDKLYPEVVGSATYPCEAFAEVL